MVLSLPLRVPHMENGKGLVCDTISALGQNVLGGQPIYYRWPTHVSLGLSLATYCGIIDDGTMTATLAAPRDPMIRFLDR